SYNVSAGYMSMKDIYRLYRYDNSLYLLPITGAELKTILEFNAATHLAVNTSTGEAVFSTKGDDFTNPIFYGIDFKYDMSRAEYDRVIDLKFSDGREVVDSEVYILAVNNYHLGNASGPFANYTTEDAIWCQTDDLGGGFVQDLIAEFLTEETAKNGGVSPAPSNWEIVYTAEIVPEAVTGQYIASQVSDPTTLETGDQVVIYYSAGNTLVTNVGDGKLDPTEDVITGEGKLGTNEAAAIFTVEKTESGAYRFVDAEDRYMTSAPTGNGLNMEAVANECSDWEFEATEGGFYIHNLGANYNGNYNQYLEYYYSFTTYKLGGGGANYTFNLYKLPETVAAYVPDPSELKDGDQVVIYYPNGQTAVTNTASGTKLAPTEDVFTTLEKLGTSEAAAVFTVKVAEDGSYAFVDAEGRYMTSGATGNALTMEAEANTCSYWHFELTEDGKGVYIFNNGANYNGNYNQALEYYGGFTTYGHKATPIYTFMVYKLVDPDCAHEHTVVRDATEAYCATPGYTGNTYCADCYVFLSKGEATAAPGHDPAHTELRDAVEAHCDVEGYTGDLYCTDCGELVTAGEAIPAPGHNPEKAEVRNAVAATCTAAGYTGDVYCLDCEKLVAAGEVIPAKGHSFGQWDCDGRTMTCHCDNCDVYQVLPCASHLFSDVDAGQWYHEAIDFVTASGLMKGMNLGIFEPNGTMTRAQLVTVLYRMAGSPTVTAGENFAFTDVNEGDWYYDAVIWAVENGITMGKTASLFAPNEAVTREQTATFFYRYAKLTGAAEASGTELSFADAALVSGYAKEAVAWCVENGILQGMGNNTLNPKGNCLRSHVATMLMNFCEEIG
ncbi:MAG: S-layer homology domain-containing protein, partial [Oscillospiraceae bacterium]|nr:S-layer homology domain-containing protein [Oscillospiraceae bacterium]